MDLRVVCCALFGLFVAAAFIVGSLQASEFGLDVPARMQQILTLTLGRIGAVLDPMQQRMESNVSNGGNITQTNVSLTLERIGAVPNPMQQRMESNVSKGFNFSQRSVNLTQPKALLALYGLQNRDHGCASPSHRRFHNMLRSMGYLVDVFIYEMRPTIGWRVDQVPWSPKSLLSEFPGAHYEWENISAVDAKIKQKCGPRCARCSYRNNDVRFLYPRVLYALRQLHAEVYVASYLESTKKLETHKVVIAVASDIMVLPGISSVDQGRIASAPAKSLFVSEDGNFYGYTNGLQIGSLLAVSSAMGRWNFGAFNYEEQLKIACNKAGLAVHGLQGHGQGRSFVKIRHNGCLKKRRAWEGTEKQFESAIVACLKSQNVTCPTRANKRRLKQKNKNKKTYRFDH